MQIFKLYLRLIKKIAPLLITYIVAFTFLIIWMLFTGEQKEPGSFLGNFSGNTGNISGIQQVFFGNIFGIQCYMNGLSFLVTLLICSGCGYFLQVIQGSTIRRRTRMLPISDKGLKFQLVLANFLYTLFVDIIFLFMGMLYLGNRGTYSWFFAYYLNLLFFSLTVLAVSYLLSFILKSKTWIICFSIGYALLNSFFGGFFIPQGRFWVSTLRILEFIPGYWFIRCNNIITASAGYGNTSLGTEISKCIRMEIIFAAAFLAVALVIGKERQKKDLY